MTNPKTIMWWDGHEWSLERVHYRGPKSYEELETEQVWLVLNRKKHVPMPEILSGYVVAGACRLSRRVVAKVNCGLVYLWTDTLNDSNDCMPMESVEIILNRDGKIIWEKK